MDADRLFLERARQISKLMESHNEIELLDLSGHLRQLLVDAYPLIHKANERHRLKLRFKVGMFRQTPDQFVLFQSLEDGVDPDCRPPGSPSKEVDLSGFLKYEVLFIKGSPRTVQDMIQFAANVAGGIHHTNNSSERQRIIAEYSTSMGIGGLPAGVRQL
jgi:hypothetical protein